MKVLIYTFAGQYDTNRVVSRYPKQIASLESIRDIINQDEQRS
jgi:hypothetical protein